MASPTAQLTTPPHVRYGSGDHGVIGVHGWFGDHRAFDAVRPHLDPDRFSYAFMDCRGYGGAKDTPGSYTMEEVSGDVLALADALGWDRFSLIGHSMGGMAVQRVLADAPERVRGLVGLSPVPATGVPFDDEQWALFSGAAGNPDNRRAILDFTTGNRLTGVWLDRMVRQSQTCADDEAFRRYLDAWAGTDFHDEIEGATLPVLVVVGQHDPALSAEVMAQTWLAFYPNARMVVLPEAGHYPMDEEPVRLATVVEEFLRDV
jgi:pimeloyl-ACP methyl ester carboxylesterase